jgi:acetate kinase
MRVLALNAGSSSIKFALFEGTKRKLSGKLSGIGDAPRLTAGDIEEGWEDDTPEALTVKLLSWIEERLDGAALDAIGHRVVHGGREFSARVRIDADILRRIDALTPLAPLHQPASVAPMRKIFEDRPDLPQVACFDTAFHHKLAPPVSRYPLPRRLEEEYGIRRYGFHGLSYEAIARKLAGRNDGAASERIIVAHLGSGASLCAMSNLESVDTTMGFTALDGIMMGTRPGSLDPGILLYLLQEKGFSAAELEKLLYHESGLLGVSGFSSDIAELLETDQPSAREAIDLYVLLIARHVAALANTLSGLDRLVFTGGVGEHAIVIRAMVVGRLSWMGMFLDGPLNDSSSETVSSSARSIRVQVIPTDEEGVIADHVRNVLSS